MGNEDNQTLIKFAGGLAPGADIESVMYSSLSSEEPNEIINLNSQSKIKFYDGDAIRMKFKSKTINKINTINASIQKASQ